MGVSPSFYAIRLLDDPLTNAIAIQQAETGSSARSTLAAAGGQPGSICVQWRWTDDPGATSDSDESSINTSTKYRGNEDPAGVDTDRDALFTTRSAVMLLGPEAVDPNDPQESENNADAASIISFCVRASKAVAMKRGAAQLKVSGSHFSPSFFVLHVFAADGS